MGMGLMHHAECGPEELTERDDHKELRPIGAPVHGFAPPPLPGAAPILTRWVRLKRMSAERDAAAIHAAVVGQDWLWDYMPNGPYSTAEDLLTWMRGVEGGEDPCFYSIFDPDAASAALGYAAFMRMDCSAGVIEIGNIMLSPAIQGARIGSAALMAMIGWAFKSGYRRVEWKCNALNAPSRRAALRFGFRFEGVFRQHMIVKGRNRDTAWFAITDRDWGTLSHAYDDWLSPDNFDRRGQQLRSLSELTRTGHQS